MTTVTTVAGPVDASALGTVLMHEHVICRITYPNTGLARELDDVEIAAEELGLFKQAGGATLVELTPRGVGRNVRKLKQIAEASGVNIIASTGFYTQITYPQEVFESTILKLADLMTRELTEGIDDTGIRAGIIGEIGTGKGNVTAAEERVFRAAARAQRRTGVAISTHTYWGGELAFDQIEILMDEGVPADRIIIGHLGDRRDYDAVASIAQTGVWIGFDHVGNKELLPDRDRAELVKKMLDGGFGPQLLLSNGLAYREQLHYMGGKGYDHLLVKFIPELQQAEVTADQIRMLLVDNPCRALAPEV